MTAICTHAYTWTDPDTDYTWTYMNNGGDTVLISSISPKPTGALTIPSQLGGKTVARIGVEAFYGSSGLASVTIPGGVTNIGRSAFYNCSRLTAISVDTDNPVYKSVDGLLLSKDGTILVRGVNGEVTIPNGVTYIGEDAFYGFSGLTSVTIGDCVTRIGKEAFRDCSGLTSVAIPDTVTSIGALAFCGCLGLVSATIPNGVTSIEDETFAWCSGLTSVTIGNRVRSIGNNAFHMCSSLTGVTIPDSVTRIGAEAFSDCDGLTSVTIGNGVRNIGVGAFFDCNGLTSVTIPDNVTSIGDDAFDSCNGLTSVTIPQCVCLGKLSGVFSSSYRSITNVVVNANVTRLADYVFQDCSSLKSVIFQGDAPDVGVCIYEGTPRSLVTYVQEDSIGWSGGISSELPDVWNERAIKVASKIGGGQAPDECVVTFDVNGYGSLSDSEKTLRLAEDDVFGTTCQAPVPAVPNRAGVGYGEFLGWYTTSAASGGTKLVDGMSVSGNITYYARWTYYRYVQFDPNGGTVPDSYRYVKNGSTVGALPTPAREGFLFDGWYTTSSDGSRISSSTTLTADSANIETPVRYYAHWAAVPFPDVTTWKFYEEADDDEGLNLAAWEDRDVPDVPFWIGAGIKMAIPVEGNLAASDVALVAGTYSDYGRVQVVSDVWMFAKHYMALKKAVGREPYGNDYGAYGSVFEDDVGGRNYSLSLDIWPEKKVVSGRQWILLEIGGRPTKGCKTFYLGVKGRDDIGYSRFRIYTIPDQGVSQTPSSWSNLRELAVLPMPIGRGTTSGSGMYASGTRVTLSAIPSKGYMFVKWSDGDTNPTRTVTMASEDSERVIYAYFEATDGGQAYGPFVAGDKVEFDIGLVGYTAKGLPSGLKYDSKKGIVSGAVKAAGEYEATFTKKGEDDETVIFTVRAEEVSVGCEGLSLGAFTSGVAGGADGIPLEIETETGVKSVAVTKLPTGMKYDAKSGLITGAPTKAGDYEVVVTVTTKSGAKQVVTIPVMVAALPENVIGTFNGFVKADDGVENQGTFQLTTTDAGKLTAKVTTAEGSYSFSGTCWDAVEGGVYSVVLATKKGEKLTLVLDSAAGWNANQLTGTFTAGSSKPSYQVIARKNAFGKTWLFKAEGNESEGWTLSYAESAKAANLTVTLNADGSTKIAGKLGTLNVSGSGYSDMTAVQDGAIIADFAPVVSMKEGKATVKRVLSIRANLWFDRSNEMHSGDIGTVKIVPGV